MVTTLYQIASPWGTIFLPGSPIWATRLFFDLLSATDVNLRHRLAEDDRLCHAPAHKKPRRRRLNQMSEVRKDRRPASALAQSPKLIHEWQSILFSAFRNLTVKTVEWPHCFRAAGWTKSNFVEFFWPGQCAHYVACPTRSIQCFSV